jgi:hypothetical protein
LPWWARIAAKIILSRLPIDYRLWQSLGLFRHGRMNDLRYSLDVFESHAARAALAGELAEKTILELGPGDSIASAVIAFAHGARAVLVDVGAFADRDPNSYLPLIKELSDRGLASPMLEAPATIEGLLQALEKLQMPRWTLSFHMRYLSMSEDTISLQYSAKFTAL